MESFAGRDRRYLITAPRALTNPESHLLPTIRVPHAVIAGHFHMQFLDRFVKRNYGCPLPWQGKLIGILGLATWSDEIHCSFESRLQVFIIMYKIGRKREISQELSIIQVYVDADIHVANALYISKTRSEIGPLYLSENES